MFLLRLLLLAIFLALVVLMVTPVVLRTHRRCIKPTRRDTGSTFVPDRPAGRLDAQPQYTFSHSVAAWRICLSRQPAPSVSTRQGSE